MTDNYYEIKTLRLKVIYLLAGWAVLIFSGSFSLNFLENYFIHHSHLAEMLGLTNMNMEGLYMMTFACLLLLPIGLLVFTNWICLRFRETWGLSILFMCMTFLSIITFFLLTSNPSHPSIEDFLCLSGLIWGILSVYQLIIFLPLFSIAYYLWIRHLKRRKNFVPLSQKTCAFLHYLNLIPVFGVGCLFYTILHLD